MMLMRNVAVSAFLLVSTVTASTDRCDVITPSMTLKFYNGARGKEGTLDEGGELRFKQVGEQYGKKLDLVITVHPGTQYHTKNNGANKNKEQFGQLNIYKKVPRKPQFNSKGTFDFCFRDSGNNGLVNIDSFHFGFYDIDQRSRNKRGSNIQRESIAIDASQMENFYLYNTSEQKSEVLARCENSKRVPTSSAPCVDERTEFMSNEYGTGYTNPSKVTNLSAKQKSRSVVFTFRNRSCFTAELRITCGGHSKCFTNEQANFLFAGAAPGIIEDTSTCVATPPEPSDSPSSDPSVSPTQGPTNTPSRELSVSPTQGPTNTPSRELSVSPTQGPTNTPSRANPFRNRRRSHFASPRDQSFQSVCQTPQDGWCHEVPIDQSKHPTSRLDSFTRQEDSLCCTDQCLGVRSGRYLLRIQTEYV
uniref:Uncharacterized protein n=1 Tax=Pseudo-nitzschia australis TaxID=44445 RepID=A0A7S4AUF0_9STRA